LKSGFGLRGLSVWTVLFAGELSKTWAIDIEAEKKEARIKANDVSLRILIGFCFWSSKKWMASLQSPNTPTQELARAALETARGIAAQKLLVESEMPARTCRNVALAFRERITWKKF
jgi:hypothetical protein